MSDRPLGAQEWAKCDDALLGARRCAPFTIVIAGPDGAKLAEVSGTASAARTSA